MAHSFVTPVQSGQTPSLCSPIVLRNSYEAFLNTEGGYHKRIIKQKEKLQSSIQPLTSYMTLSGLINLPSLSFLIRQMETIIICLSPELL